MNSAIIKRQLVMTRWGSLAAKVAGADPVRGAVEHDRLLIRPEQHRPARHVLVLGARPPASAPIVTLPHQRVSSSPGSKNDSFVAVV
ncbi:hypothetical protein ASPBRDRAFT_49725, partial [Aspergillus brasiliensis CBS 101740]